MNWPNGPIQFLRCNVSDYVLRTVLETPLPGELENLVKEFIPNTCITFEVFNFLTI